MTYQLSYFTTIEQENAVSEKIQPILAQLNLGGKTDYEKVEAIYNYICTHVEYEETQSYDLKYSAYAALINGKAVCQGYSSLFYRMAMEAGIENRVVFGKSRGQNHAWNIVKLDGVYYNLDCTWDAVMADHSYFLKTDANMADHTRDADYQTAEFYTAYPMAGADYPIPKAPEPTVPPTQAPVEVPTITPTTQPATQPATQMPVETTMMPSTQIPTTEPEKLSEPTSGSSSVTESAVPTAPEQETREDTGILWIAAVGLLGAAVCAAAVLQGKRKRK